MVPGAFNTIIIDRLREPREAVYQGVVVRSHLRKEKSLTSSIEQTSSVETEKREQGGRRVNLG